jgi:predicted dehydrogenase
VKIGFVDHHLNNFHATRFLELLHGPLAPLGARVTAAWESDPTGEDWCARHKVPRANSAAAVAEHVDAVIVLAPDNIDAHLGLVRQVAPAGRPLMVDKYLAPTTADAREIADLCRRHACALFSASSLRFAVELEAVLRDAGAPDAGREAYARGMGEWAGYGVHTLSHLPSWAPACAACSTPAPSAHPL